MAIVASQVPYGEPDWLMHRRIPRHGLTLIVGPGGAGKSTFMAHLTALWTRGKLTGRNERVLFALVEDDRESVTVPRLMAAEADLSSSTSRATTACACLATSTSFAPT